VWRWSMPMPSIAGAFCAGRKIAWLVSDHGGPQGRDHSSRPPRGSGRRPGTDPAPCGEKIHHLVLPLAGDFQTSNALVAARSGHRAWRESATGPSRPLEHLKGAPGRMEKVAFAKIGRRADPMSITPIRRTSLEKVLPGAAAAHRRKAACDCSAAAADRDKRQASADGRYPP